MNKNFEPDCVKLARFAKALAHPARIKILKHLLKCKCCFTGEMVEVLPLAQSTVSQHLKELKDAGLIQGEIMPPRVRYCIDKKKFLEAKELFDKFFFLFEDFLKE